MIRDADYSDVDKLLEIGDGLFREALFYFGALDKEKIRESLYDHIDSNVWYVRLYEEGGILMGVMTGIVGDYFFADKKFAAQDMLYVVPEKRNGGIAGELVHDFVSWAENSGADHVIGSSMNGNGKIDNLFKRMGFKYAGPKYILELDDGSR